jgi:integrase
VQGEALEIVKRLVAAYPEGKLFRNRRGLDWSKFAVCNRFHRLSQRTGKRMFCYAARHGFATRKLIQGKGTLTNSQLMGHTDGTMLARVYGHLDKNVDFLKQALVD